MPEVGKYRVPESRETVLRLRVLPLDDRGKLQVVAREDEPSAVGEQREDHREVCRPHLGRFVDDEEVKRRKGLLEPLETVHRPPEEEGRVADDGVGPVVGQNLEAPLAPGRPGILQLVYREPRGKPEFVDRVLHPDEQVLDGGVGERRNPHPDPLPVRPPGPDEGEYRRREKMRLPGPRRPPYQREPARHHPVKRPGLALREPGVEDGLLRVRYDRLRLRDRGGKPPRVAEEPDERVLRLAVQGEEAVDVTRRGEVGEPGMQHRTVALDKGRAVPADVHREDEPPDDARLPVDDAVVDPGKGDTALPGVRAIPVAEVVKPELRLLPRIAVRHEEVPERLRLFEESEIEGGSHLPEVSLALLERYADPLPDPHGPRPAPQFLHPPGGKRRLVLRHEEEAR
ncbi:MAG: hypothetical protein BWX50_01269 [Euryarchaeota archaeon ADurb.Bin009]|nr:MAG: hypothetical protein BWX50_01269 [Euryarchaeota archaeon ADurb.Bin009]